MSHAVFEVSWEVANKVGGIHTVVASKAPTMVARYGDDYVAIGPLLAEDRPVPTPFEEEDGFEDFREACREAGVEARVGHWAIAGRPRTILVGFSRLFEKKDGILAGLWERSSVDSLFGEWDYVEPVLFAHAAGIAIDKWWHEHVAHRRIPAVAQFHEWMCGAGLLYLKENLPAVGTVFTTHATMLGRAIASTGASPLLGLGDRSAADAARDYGVRSKHSMEGACVRESDVFTTVSRITAEEAELYHGRAADPLLPNGLDLDVIDQLAGRASFEEVRDRLGHVAWAVTGEDLSDAFYVCISGRYEMHNKGMDLLLEALARLEGQAGRPIVAFFLVPAGTTGLRRDIRDRMAAPERAALPALGLSTHDLIDADRDPVQRLAKALGLGNATGSRVKVVHVPVYLDGRDGLLDLPYETVLKAMDLGCYPSFYEPWGYTPAECISVGVPTVTTDCAGFGLWAREQGLGLEDGVHVLPREGRADAEAAADLAAIVERLTSTAPDRERIARVCRTTAGALAWSDLIVHYETAFDRALAVARGRGAREPLEPRRRKLPLTPRPTEPSPKPRLVPFRVAARIPTALAGLDRLARNLWWTWDPPAAELFASIDPPLFRAVGENPLALLGRVAPARLEELAESEDFLRHLDAVVQRFDAYAAEKRARVDLGGGSFVDAENPIAYFCFEYALHPALHSYAGGLGVLAGDHLKSASDLDLPLVAVGLLYRGGYAEQEIGPRGDPASHAASDDPREQPLTRVVDSTGVPVRVEVGLPDRKVQLQAWCAQVGRVPLYLLDADVPENRPEDRVLTQRLYAGGREARLVQEILLGKGGFRLLVRMGIHPAVLHLNEGHAGFAPLERVAHLVHDHGLAPDEAWTVVRSTTAFTTHTPVPAGHDVFDEDLVRRYFGQTPAWTGLSWERFLELGRAPGDGGGFNMTYLSMSFASWINGVSRRHGEVSRALLHPFWPGLLEDELPVEAVTNGVHLPTWTAPEVLVALGVRERPVRGEDFRQIAEVSDEALWELRHRVKERMLIELSQRIEGARRRRGSSQREVGRLQRALRSDALYLVFARRFSPYKRPALIFRERERLRRLLADEDRPVRILFAGKAHPEDELGQQIVKEVASLSRHPDFAGRVLFLPNYDLALARQLVHGADVWLNNPTPPLEASGTSGMKSAANGGLNLSVLDGWWIEGWDGSNGWGIDACHENLDPATCDDLDAAAILTLLEEEVVPTYFDRDGRGVPTRWIERVRSVLLTLPRVFNTERMVGEYARRAYAPLAASFQQLGEARFAAARALAAEQRHLHDAMAHVQIAATRIGQLDELAVGDVLEAEVDLTLGELAPRDVVVELVLGARDGRDGQHVRRVGVHALAPQGSADGGLHRYGGRATLAHPGPAVYGLRVRPRASASRDLVLYRLVRWA